MAVNQKPRFVHEALDTRVTRLVFRKPLPDALGRSAGCFAQNTLNSPFASTNCARPSPPAVTTEARKLRVLAPFFRLGDAVRSWHKAQSEELAVHFAGLCSHAVHPFLPAPRATPRKTTASASCESIFHASDPVLFDLAGTAPGDIRPLVHSNGCRERVIFLFIDSLESWFWSEFPGVHSQAFRCFRHCKFLRFARIPSGASTSHKIILDSVLSLETPTDFANGNYRKYGDALGFPPGWVALGGFISEISAFN